MKLGMGVTTNLKIKEAQDQLGKASKYGLVTAVAAIANAAIKGSPWLTGHNRRSIAYAVGSKTTKTGHASGDEKPFNEYNLNLKEYEGAIYSTSGYGGFLETGTSRMAARPYFKPALDMNIKLLPAGIKAELK